MTDLDNLIARLEAAKKGEGRLGVVATINEAIERLSPPCPYCKGRGGWTGETKWGEQDADCDGCDGTGIAPTPLDGEGVERVIEAARSAMMHIECFYEAKDADKRIRAVLDAIDLLAAHRRAALATLTPREQRMEEAWQPIETAPKDAFVIGWAPGWMRPSQVIFCAFIGKRKKQWRFSNLSEPGLADPPTHWRPLPEPPALASADAVLGEGK